MNEFYAFKISKEIKDKISSEIEMMTFEELQAYLNIKELIPKSAKTDQAYEEQEFGIIGADE